MSLDFDFTPYYNLTLPITKEKVQYRPYLVGEEITFLTHLETEDVTDFINSILNITKNCVKKPEVFDNMNLVDFTYLTANIRAKSKGEEIIIPRKCPECGNQIEAKFDISNDLYIRNENNTSMIIPLTDEIKIEVGILPYDHLVNIIAIETKDETKNSELLTIAACVKKVIHKGKIYSNLTIDEIYNDVMVKLSSKHLKILVKEMKKLPIIYGEINFDCGCGYKEIMEVDNVLNFLA